MRIRWWKMASHLCGVKGNMQNQSVAADGRSCFAKMGEFEVLTFDELLKKPKPCPGRIGFLRMLPFLLAVNLSSRSCSVCPIARPLLKRLS